MNDLEALWLGIVQGLTEFLPVSSSGHLVIAETLLGLVPSFLRPGARSAFVVGFGGGTTAAESSLVGAKLEKALFEDGLEDNVKGLKKFVAKYSGTKAAQRADHLLSIASL